MPIQIFKTDKLFYKLLKQHVPTFDDNKSLALSRFSILDTDGKFYPIRRLSTLIELVNTMASKPFLCPKRSSASGRAIYKIWVLDDKEEIKTKEVLVEDAVQVEEDFNIEDMMQQVNDLTVDSEFDEVEVSDKVQPDWEWIGTLENKKYDKEKLDVYAEENFNIQLNKRNTLENMVKDFKESLQ